MRAPSPTPVASATPFVHPCPYSINGVRLNMTGPEVSAVLGKPTGTSDRRWNYQNAKLHLTMSFMYDHIWSVQCSKAAVFARNGKEIPLLGMTREQVQSTFGKPDESTKTSVLYYRDLATLTIHFRKDRVSEMGLFDDRDSRKFATPGFPIDLQNLFGMWKVGPLFVALAWAGLLMALHALFGLDTLTWLISTIFGLLFWIVVAIAVLVREPDRIQPEPGFSPALD